ncbi:MAG: hypothetical protein AAF928_17530 [Myxococcota bacterium]
MGSDAPLRYRVVDDPPAIVAEDWPSILLHVTRGHSVEPSERDQYPDQSIFLDGVYTGPAFLDNERRQYSLDHHAGCVRAFTLATCEQATVMLMQGLPLREGVWHLYVNEPDLDAMLGAWVLMNHHALTHDDYALLRKAMPLIRVEGVIDAYGFDKALLSGLPRKIFEAHKKRIDKLRAEEKRLRNEGTWDTVNVVDFSLGLLERFDAALFPRGQPRSGGIETQDQAALPSRKVAVLVRSTLGIYEVEEQLKEPYRGELAAIVLDKGEGRMTLRLADAFLPKNLRDVYLALNEADPHVTDDDEGNAWGGSDDIGGSPRRSGSGLSGKDVLDVVSAVFRGDDEARESRTGARVGPDGEVPDDDGEGPAAKDGASPPTPPSSALGEPG